jgi:diguanylate cyclase
MAETTNPTGLARETLKVLASRRIPPTPQNYQRIFYEIAGTPAESGLGGRLLALARDLASRNPDDGALRTLVRGLEQNNLEEVSGALQLFAGRGDRAPSDLGPALRWTLRQLEFPHRGLSPARKREGLERLLIGFGTDPQLPVRLRALARSWADTPADGPVDALQPVSLDEWGAPVPADAGPGEEAVLLREAGEVLASVLENGVAPRLDRYADVYADVIAASRRARELDGAAALGRLAQQLKQLWLKVELRVEPDQEVIDNLLRLIGMLVSNLGELVDDDQWISGQLDVLRVLVNGPVDLRAIREAERGFREVVFKQASIKSNLNDAKTTLKSLLSTFVERLGDVAANTGDYHARIERYAERIESTDSLDSLRTLLDEIMGDTRGMQVDMRRSRDELVAARQQAEAAEKRVHALEAELVRVSEQVREDQLTGTLNRRGMDDALTRELARARRTGKPLSVVVLDVDNFKKINDTHGHAAGDAALVHLAKVIKHTVRPTDSIARYGGEEFVIILSETALAEGALVAQRLQRELTRKFFLHDQERLLITFSAGVTEYAMGEEAEALVQRADKAMYQAKLQGKNRVVTG